MDKLSGCGCCGCQVIENKLYPDFYTPEYLCHVKTTDNTTVTVETETVVYTYTNGVLVDVATDVVSTVDQGDGIPVYTLDNRPVFGKFSQNYNYTSGWITKQPSTLTNGTIGQGTWQFTRIRERTTTIGNLSIERKLLLLFDLSAYSLLGRENIDEEAIIKGVHFRIETDRYMHPEIVDKMPLNSIGEPVISLGNGPTISGVLKAFSYQDFAPSDELGFDTFRAGMSNSLTVTGDHTTDIKAWLPSEEKDYLWMSIQCEDSSGGGLIDVAKMAIADRSLTNSNVTQAYDWKTDWTRDKDDIAVWNRTTFLPDDNYQVNLSEIVPAKFWNTEGSRLSVEFYTMVEDPLTEELVREVLIEAHYEVVIGPAIPRTQYEIDNDFHARHEWSIQGTGTWGTYTAVKTTLRADTFEELGIGSVTATPFTVFGPKFNFRGSVVEVTGGAREEGGITANYNFIPHWKADEPFPPLQLTLTLDSGDGDPQPGTYHQTGLSHLVDQKNLTCPPGTTCPIIDDYAHPEWRVSAQSLTDFPDTRLPSVYTHLGCTVTAATEANTEDITFELDWYKGYALYKSVYQASANPVYNNIAYRLISNSLMTVGPANGIFSNGVGCYYTDTVNDLLTYPAWVLGGGGVHDYSNWNIETDTDPETQELEYTAERVTFIHGCILDEYTYEWQYGSVYAPNYPGTVVPDKQPWESTYGTALGPAQEFDLSGYCNYVIEITVKNPYDSNIMESLPPYNNLEDKAFSLNEKVLIAEEVFGAGSVFKCTSVTFVGEVTHYNFTWEGQHSIPTLSEVPEEEDVEDLIAVLGGGSWWFIVGEDHYRVDSNGISDPLPETGAVLPENEQVEVHLTYNASCFSVTSPSSAEIFSKKVVSVIDTLSYSSSEQLTTQPPFAEPIEEYEWPEDIVAAFDGVPPGGYTFNSFTADVRGPNNANRWIYYNDENDDEVPYGWFTSSSITVTPVEYVPYYNAFSGETITAYNVTNTFEDMWDHTWNLSSHLEEWHTVYAVYPVVFSGMYAGGAVIRMVKLVDKWKNRNLPTLEFTSADLLTYVDPVSQEVQDTLYQIVKLEVPVEEFKPSPLYRGDIQTFDHQLPFDAQNLVAPPGLSVDVIYHIKGIAFSGLSVTIGPSSYVPPEA